jgi:hypothetical protein
MLTLSINRLCTRLRINGVGNESISVNELYLERPSPPENGPSMPNDWSGELIGNWMLLVVFWGMTIIVGKSTCDRI